MLPPSLDRSVDSSPQALAIILRTTLSILDSYAPRVRESNSLRDLERALICAISDLKRADATGSDRVDDETLAGLKRRGI